MGKISFLVFSLSLIPAGCSVFQDRTAGAIRLAEVHGFKTAVVSTTHFKLRIFHRGLAENSGHLRVYIEGDGNAWRRKNRLSRDPTPLEPVGLELAVRDPEAPVLYIARPCQFLVKPELSGCSSIYWSSHRYSEKVIDSINQAIEKKAGHFESISVIGYSGGGSVAALVTERRDDVTWFMTIAANLDHQAWTSLHQVTPLHGSLNAVDYMERLQKIPQTHLVGANDKNVPVSLLKDYRNAADNPARIDIIEIDGYDHACCWKENWRKLLCTYNPATIKICSAMNSW